MDIVMKVVEFLVEPIARQLGYLIFYNRNVRELIKEVEVVISKRDRLQPRIDAAHRNGENIVEDLLDWQVQVDKAKVEAQSFKRHCWNTSRYSLSRKAKKMTQDVIVLQQKGERFITGIIAFPPSPGWPQPHNTTGVESYEISFLVNGVLETLKDDKLYLIGIHGINREDMKRLVNNIYRRAKDENQFEDVAIAVERNERKIQEEIAYWLGLKFDSKIDAVRQHRLSKRLVDNRKKLILLDDVCEVLNLEAIGIVPFGEGEGNKTCKIIVTSSDKSICEKMNTQKNYKLEVHKQMLLFGGNTGDLWDDKAHTTIRSVIVVYNATGICSFQTEYDDNGHSSMSLTHDFVSKSRHDNEVKIELRHPDEFIISVSGYYKSESNHVVLNSLKFESNKQTYGPFGLETGQPFTSPLDVGKVIGFYGRNNHNSLDAIGFYYEPISIPTEDIQRTSAFGGPGGGNSFDDGPNTTIRKLEIEFDNVINSIHVEYDLNGRSKWTDLHGSSRGGKRHMLQLDYPGEFIISVSGYTRGEHIISLPWLGLTSCTVIGSLTIQTNRKKYGPFGRESGSFFSFPSSDIGKIVGFHGTCGIYLDTLGAYIEPFPAQNPTTLFDRTILERESFFLFPSNDPGKIGGRYWDDGAAHTTIRQIILKVSNKGLIVLLKIEYDKNGRSEWSAPPHGSEWSSLHGGLSTCSEVVIKLDYPGEFLISMSGKTDAWVIYWERCRVVSSLTFQSNRRTYGPYGNDSGNPFSTSNSGKIVGFQGKSADCLESIGAHFEPFSNSF